MCPADGWRVVYIHEPDEDGPGWSGTPLAGWGIFEVTEHPVKGEVGVPVERDREIHGVVATSEGEVYCTAEMANLWRYLAPGEPDPTPEEVAAEQARRKR